MFKLSYSTNGLTELSFEKAVFEVEKAGFQGIELSFQKNEFNPFTLNEFDIKRIKNILENSNIKPVCISTATTFFLSDIAHEPSLLSLDYSRRKQRIDLIKKGIEIAKQIDIPIVSFQSGYLREEHIKNPLTNPRELLVSGIKECLESIEDVILVIEPEPGMYIETLEDAVNLIKEVDSDNFRLHVDICHAYCTEKDYINSILKYISYTEYMHLADIKEGYNLKFVALNLEDFNNFKFDFNFASYLIYVNDYKGFIFISENNYYCFYHDEFQDRKDKFLENLYRLNEVYKNIVSVSMENLINLNTEPNLDIEIKAYLDSISKINCDILNSSIPILKYLRNEKVNYFDKIISKPICNTINGKVHYHEIPGNGQIDFRSVFYVLKNNYNKYITVELYNHSSVWEKVLYQSKEYLLSCIK
ncbi:sugar phosphate isomerase/epimerase family protein [Clostridium botulinum]|uniref:sugar phosphate isomerase/epimerase family protein n=1 Tax=Clostridium botulinum TaxID=1491 RepID=UPI0013FBEA39|nr:sugar phosphate isomerase/epimerase [Clostridium botulinum]NFB60992.1 sugar phosphate isomerase/epimerase [Clostridium botulinum]